MKYKLLKDLPFMNAGTVFNYVCCENGKNYVTAHDRPIFTEYENTILCSIIKDKHWTKQHVTVFDTKMVNNLIRYWRAKKLNAKTEEEVLIAACYVDAFQTMRINHGLNKLPLQETKNSDIQKNELCE